MNAKFTLTIAAFYLLSSGIAFADLADDKLDAVAALNKVAFEKIDGYLFQGWMQFDENDKNYVVYIGNRKYKALLDDGRGTTERANKCMEENIFDENPATGCSVNFDGEYLVESNMGSIEVKVKIWNVLFK